MHRVSVMAVAALVSVLVSACVPPDARAQRYGNRGQQQAYCASNDNRGTRCRMPWRDSALVQQMSSAACIEGQTWGSDPYTVWVKDGCRGNFGEARGWWRGGYDGYRNDRDDRDDGDDRGGAEVYCASNDNRGARCQMPWRRATLSRQMSNAACIEGETWGSDPYSVWVKDGCRGQFRAAWGGRGGW